MRDAWGDAQVDQAKKNSGADTFHTKMIDPIKSLFFLSPRKAAHAHTLCWLFFARRFSLKMEAEKLAQEKTEIQRQYIMVSVFERLNGLKIGLRWTWIRLELDLY